MTVDNKPPKLGDLMPRDYGDILKRRFNIKHRATIYRIVNGDDVDHPVHKAAMEMAEEYQKELQALQAKKDKLLRKSAA